MKKVYKCQDDNRDRLVVESTTCDELLSFTAIESERASIITLNERKVQYLTNALQEWLSRNETDDDYAI